MRVSDKSKIAKILKIEEERIVEIKDKSFIINGLPQAVRGNTMFDEKNYTKVELNSQLLRDYSLSFKKIKITNPLSFDNATFPNVISFIDCIFDEDFKIKNSTLQGEMRILNSRFKKGFNLCTSRCEKNIRIRQTTFEGSADFHHSSFEGIFDLYGSEFYQIPDFSGCVYGVHTNLVGTIIPIQYEAVRDWIYQKQETRKKFFKEDWSYKDFSYLVCSDYQDNFRGLKYLCLKESNILGSSQYHMAELYCKEIELNFKPNKSLREWIDWFQLFFYRLTSDHHTDLLKIIGWVIVCIGIFGVSYFGFKLIQDFSILSQLNPYGLTLSFVGSILALPFCATTQKPFFEFRRYLIILSSISTLWIACYKPILIFGAINLIDKSPRSGLENFFLVLYTLMMILLLFSLQKTARKNSIVPS